MNSSGVRGGNPRRYQVPGAYGNLLPGATSALDQQVMTGLSPGSEPGFWPPPQTPGGLMTHSSGAIVPPSFEDEPATTLNIDAPSVATYVGAFGPKSAPTYATQGFSEHTVLPGSTSFQQDVGSSATKVVPKRARKTKKVGVSVYWNNRQDFDAIDANFDLRSTEALVNPTTAMKMGCKTTPLREPLEFGHLKAVGECLLHVRSWMRNIEVTEVTAYVLDEDSPDFEHIKLGSDFMAKVGKAGKAITARNGKNHVVPPTSDGGGSVSTIFQSPTWNPVTTDVVPQSQRYLSFDFPTTGFIPESSTSTQFPSPDTGQNAYYPNDFPAYASPNRYGYEFPSSGPWNQFWAAQSATMPYSGTNCGATSKTTNR